MVIEKKEDLAKAIKEEQEYIEIKGDLKKKVIIIKSKGKVAWLVASGAIAVAVISIICTGGTATPAATAFMAPVAVSILGIKTAVFALSLAIISGGVGILNKLRKYEIVENNNNRLILKKK